MYIGLIPTVISSSSSTVTVNCLPQRQQNISVVSQPNSCVIIVSDTHTTISSTPVTTVSVVECLTINSSVVTSISGQDVSSNTTASGLQMFSYTVINTFRVTFMMKLTLYIHIIAVIRSSLNLSVDVK